MFWLYPLLGAGAGALMNKKDPLTGALLGAGLGAGGGLLAGGAGAAAAPTSQAGLLAAQEAGLGSASMGWGGAQSGVQGALNGALGADAGAGVGGFLGASEKPVMAALQGAQIGQSMAPPEHPIQPQPLPQRQNIDMSGLLSQSANQQQLDQEEQRRRQEQMRQYMLGIR